MFMHPASCILLTTALTGVVGERRVRVGSCKSQFHRSMFVYYDDLKAGCGEANVIVSTSNKSIVHHGEILEISQLSVKFLIFPFMKFLGVKYQNKPTALSSIISPVTYVTYNVCISTDPQLSLVKILKIMDEGCPRQFS